MIEAYCTKCKGKTEQKNSQLVMMKNGKPARKGTCAVCGTNTNLIVSTKEMTQA